MNPVDREIHLIRPLLIYLWGMALPGAHAHASIGLQVTGTLKRVHDMEAVPEEAVKSSFQDLEEFTVFVKY
jgi:hypothetical protein